MNPYERAACSYACDRMRAKTPKRRKQCEECEFKTNYFLGRSFHHYPKKFCQDVREAVSQRMMDLLQTDKM